MEAFSIKLPNYFLQKVKNLIHLFIDSGVTFLLRRKTFERRFRREELLVRQHEEGQILSFIVYHLKFRT